MRPATLRGHGGIRRQMPDKSESRQPSSRMQANNNNGATVVSSKTLSDKLQKMDTNDSMEDINLDRSMSKSLEEALFYQPLKKSSQQPHPTETTISKATTTTSASTTTTTLKAPMSRQNIDGSQHQPSITRKETNSQQISSNDDSSILKLNLPDDSQISSTCSNSNSMDDDDSSILPASSSSAANCDITPTPFVPPSSLNVQSPFRGISLKDFESHRKMIEEQNRQKKDLLYKVIEQQ